jgi:hypothetical protein
MIINYVGVANIRIQIIIYDFILILRHLTISQLFYEIL